MSVFAIGDLHLSFSSDKPMNIFAGWNDYVDRIKDNWESSVKNTDTVILAGDTSWAMKLNDTLPDFTFINQLPGKKIILKGNHDYWWNTKTMMERFIEANHLDTLDILFNNSFTIDNVSFCGTRGWMFEEGEREDGSITKRELGRLELSLQSAPDDTEKIVFLHYPPVFGFQVIPEFFDCMNQYHVKKCYYGHLHGNSIGLAFQGEYCGIHCELISSDYLQFKPKLIV